MAKAGSPGSFRLRPQRCDPMSSSVRFNRSSWGHGPSRGQTALLQKECSRMHRDPLWFNTASPRSHQVISDQLAAISSLPSVHSKELAATRTAQGLTIRPGASAPTDGSTAPGWGSASNVTDPAGTMLARAAGGLATSRRAPSNRFTQ